MYKTIFLLIFLNTISFYSQSSHTGEILTSENIGIPNAEIVIKGANNHRVYSNISGRFTTGELKKTDTLSITATGYHDTLVTNISGDLPIKIYLKKINSETLNELVIITYNSRKRRWINFFGNKSGKFRKKYYRNEYYDVQTLFKDNVNINQFIAPDTLKIVGFSVYTVDSGLKQDITLRPIILENELDINNNLVKDSIKKFSLGNERKGKIISLEFSFENVITFTPGELVNLGIELISSDNLYPHKKNYLPIICYNKETIPISSFRKNISTEIYSETNNSKALYERPFYFELKIID